MPIFAKAHTPDGFVVRTRRGPCVAEVAYRHAYYPSQEISVQYGSKGPWVVTNLALVPADVLHEFAQHSEPERKGSL